MLEAAAQQGITHVACTPHGNDRANEQTDRLLQSVFLQVKDAAKSAGIPVELALASELMLGVDLLKTLALPFATYHGAGKYFLIEFPWQTPFEIILNAVRVLGKSGVRPVIAHYERYERGLKKPELAQELRAQGAVLTLDAGSLVGQFGNVMTKRAKQLLKWNAIDILASDAHNNQEHGFYLKQGMEAAAGIVGEEHARKMVVEHPQRVWDGSPWPEQRIQ